jgi:hypothetical protein
MPFKEPTRKSLTAMAGWALSKRENASDAQVLALDAFRNGCGGLAEVVEDLPGVGAITKRKLEAPAPVVHQEAIIPDAVRMVIAPDVQVGGECSHKFHIMTQRCVYCGKTYREVKGHKPELF